MKKSVITAITSKYDLNDSNPSVKALVAIINSDAYQLLKDDDEIPEPFVVALRGLRNPQKMQANHELISGIKFAVAEATDSSVLFDHLSPGDLVYGFEESRSALISLLAKQGKKDPIIIDGYNNFARSFIGPTDNPPMKLNTDAAKAALDLHRFVGQFEGANHFERYYYRQGWGVFYAEAAGTGLDDFIKKRCKYGILWELDRGKKIHVVLDGYDFKSCFEKSIQKYTYSEFRFMYRNWDNLEAFHKAEKLVFYATVGGKLVTVPPPWSHPEVKALAEAYQSKMKHGKKALYTAFFSKMHTPEEGVSLAAPKPRHDKDFYRGLIKDSYSLGHFVSPTMDIPEIEVDALTVDSQITWALYHFLKFLKKCSLSGQDNTYLLRQAGRLDEALHTFDEREMTLERIEGVTQQLEQVMAEALGRGERDSFTDDLYQLTDQLKNLIETAKAIQSGEYKAARLLAS